MKHAHEKNLKRVSLELGGKSPFIIMDDVTLDDYVMNTANQALFFNKGECCAAASRIFVHEKKYDEFIEKSVKLAKSAVLGDPLLTITTQGPQVSDKQRDRVMSYIEKGKKEGATLLTGGKTWGSRGYFIEPTVFADVTDSMTIAKEEIFGPVMQILKFKDINEVI